MASSLGCTPALAQEAPADALTFRLSGGVSATTTVGGAGELGLLANYDRLAVDLEALTVPGQLVVQGGVGFKFKIASTAQNMGYTAIYAGLRGQGGARPLVGIRDFITVDVSPNWSWALQWRAQGWFGLDPYWDLGLATGAAWREEDGENLAVLVGVDQRAAAPGSPGWVVVGAHVAHQFK